MDTLTIPASAEILRNIAACDREIRALRRLLKMARAAESARDARLERSIESGGSHPSREVQHD